MEVRPSAALGTESYEDSVIAVLLSDQLFYLEMTRVRFIPVNSLYKPISGNAPDVFALPRQRFTSKLNRHMAYPR